jgi:hypothetical protein
MLDAAVGRERQMSLGVAAPLAWCGLVTTGQTRMPTRSWPMTGRGCLRRRCCVAAGGVGVIPPSKTEDPRPGLSATHLVGKEVDVDQAAQSIDGNVPADGWRDARCGNPGAPQQVTKRRRLATSASIDRRRSAPILLAPGGRMAL